MASRLELHNKLIELLGNNNVYYQPPSNAEMKYPAIKYSKDDVYNVHANDGKYLKNICYEIVVIDRSPDNPVINKLLDLPYCSYDRHYVADNLNHDVLTIYY